MPISRCPANAVLPETADIETSSEEYAQRFRGEIGAWFLEVQKEATLRMLAGYKQAFVLDVGGGHGQLAPALVNSGFNVTVLGSALICSERIQDLVDQGLCRFDVGNVLYLPYPDQAFDVVLSYRLLPHVVNWRRYLQELGRVAKCAVIVDYAEVRSINFFAPFLFAAKRRLEGNTRTFSCFRERELLDVLMPIGFRHAERYAEFFLPMVLHRTLKSPRISSAVEGVARLSGLADTFGSPVILKMIRHRG